MRLKTTVIFILTIVSFVTANNFGQCGYSNSSPNARIVGGVKATVRFFSKFKAIYIFRSFLKLTKICIKIHFLLKRLKYNYIKNDMSFVFKCQITLGAYIRSGRCTFFCNFHSSIVFRTFTIKGLISRHFDFKVEVPNPNRNPNPNPDPSFGTATLKPFKSVNTHPNGLLIAYFVENKLQNIFLNQKRSLLTNLRPKPDF
jgi:hypothetical protein